MGCCAWAKREPDFTVLCSHCVSDFATSVCFKAELHLKTEVLLFLIFLPPYYFWMFLLFWADTYFWKVLTPLLLRSPRWSKWRFGTLSSTTIWDKSQVPGGCGTIALAMGSQLWSTRKSQPAFHIQDGGVELTLMKATLDPWTTNCMFIKSHQLQYL